MSGIIKMSEPFSITTTLGLLKTKYAVAISGFLGTAVTLSFLDSPLGKLRLVVALASGSLTANYLTPVLGFYLSIPAAIHGGVGFLLGILAMGIIPGLMKIGDDFRTGPISFVKRLIKR